MPGKILAIYGDSQIGSRVFVRFSATDMDELERLVGAGQMRCVICGTVVKELYFILSELRHAQRLAMFSVFCALCAEPVKKGIANAKSRPKEREAFVEPVERRADA